MCTDFRGRGGSRRPGRRRASPAEERAEAAAGGAEAAGGPSAGAGGERPSSRPRGDGRRAGGRSGGVPCGGEARPRGRRGPRPELGSPPRLGCDRLPAPARGARRGAPCAAARAAWGHRRGSATPSRQSWVRRGELGRRGHGQAWERRAKCCVGLKHGGSERVLGPKLSGCVSQPLCVSPPPRGSPPQHHWPLLDFNSTDTPCI